MTQLMDVTIIIVSWNSQDLIGKCLQDLSEQTVRPHRVIVIDNNSSDNSAEIAEKYNNVEVYRMSDNLGFSAGNNRALKLCETEWVALLNPDAFPEPDWLENLQKATIENPDVEVFGSRQLSHENPDIIDGIGDVYHISGVAWRKYHGSQQQADDYISTEIFSPCAAAALYKRQALIDIDGFDEDYFCYMEDVDLGFRLQLADHKAMYVPDAIIHHVGSATTGGKHSDFSVYYGHRNMVWTYVKDMPGILFWPLLPLHVLLNMITIFWFALHGKTRVILRSKWDAIKGIPRMWSKRKQIQKNRKTRIADIWSVLDKSLYRGR